ncbi:DUF1552 domain-containing protein [Sorangium sp. So ce388]
MMPRCSSWTPELRHRVAPVQDRLLVVDGLDMKSARGEQHQSGIIAWLTGTRSSTSSTGATPPSPRASTSCRAPGVRSPAPGRSLTYCGRWRAW